MKKVSNSSKGEIVIFNRSHYEDVIEARVERLAPEDVWFERYRQINEFERYLYENNIKTVKQVITGFQPDVYF